jgi:hypothetical protein
MSFQEEVQKAAASGSPSPRDIFNSFRNQVFELEHSFKESFNNILNIQNSFLNLIKTETKLLDLLEISRKSFFLKISSSFSGEINKINLNEYNQFIIFSENLKNECMSRLYAFTSSNNSNTSTIINQSNQTTDKLYPPL